MQYQFNAAQVNPDQREVLPLDWYPVTITSEEWTENSNKTGHYLRFMLKVSANHPRAGATQKDDMNLDNPSQEAVRIAHQRLSAYCHVTGILQMQDSRQLHNIPLQAQIGPQKDNKQYGEVISLRYADGRPLSGQPGAAAPPLPAPVAVPGPAFGGTPGGQQWGAPAPQQFQQAPSPNYGPPAPTYPVQAYPAPPQQPNFGGPPAPVNPMQPGAPVPFAGAPPAASAGYAPSAPTAMTYPSNAGAQGFGPQPVNGGQQPPQAPTQWAQQPPQPGGAPWKS